MARNFIDILPVYKNRNIESSNYSLETQNQICAYSGENREYVIMKDLNTGKCMMSDHLTEAYTNKKFIDNAKGDVLVFGLGLGFILFPLMEDPSITRIVVVEIDEHWIQTISPIIKDFDKRGVLEIRLGDAKNYYEKLSKSGEKFDTIYFDIWQDVNEEAIKEISFFHSTYLQFLKDSESYIDSWLSEKTKVWKRSLAKNFHS